MSTANREILQLPDRAGGAVVALNNLNSNSNVTCSIYLHVLWSLSREGEGAVDTGAAFDLD
jgi:hypothetical protein